MAEEAETEDQFELRLKFKKYIKSISNQQTLKSTISFCTKNERNSSIIFECIMENLKEVFGIPSLLIHYFHEFVGLQKSKSCFVIFRKSY